MDEYADMSPSFPSRLLLFLLPCLGQCLPSRPLSRRHSPSPHQSLLSAPPPSSGHAQFGSQHLAAQAFASKLAQTPLLPHEVPDASQQSSIQPMPRFVANNGPLIRASDGQFVLAPAPPSDFHQQPFSFFASPPPVPQSQLGLGPSALVSPHQSSATLPPSPFPSPPPDLPPLLNGSSPPTSPDLSTTSSPPTAAPMSPVDKSVDLDGDGALSLSEVQYAAFVHHGLSSSVVENMFNEVDRNRDGILNSLEFNDIRPLVLAKAENAALRFLQSVDIDHNGLLSLAEAQNFILKEYGISNRDVERIWRLVVPSSGDEMDAVLFSKLRRRVRGMSIRLARQIMKGADRNEDGHIDLKEAQLIAFEQEGIGPGEVVEMLASVDDNNDGELNAPEFADFERIVRARAIETSKKALKVVDSDGSGTITMDEAKRIAFDHYAFDEATLEPFFAQADENEDEQLDAVEFAGFRSVIRGRAVKNAVSILAEMDEDGDGMISEAEAEQRTRSEDDIGGAETRGLFAVADQDKNGLMDKVELADFARLVRLTSIKFVADHLRDFDHNRDKMVTEDELEKVFGERDRVESMTVRRIFDRADVDRSGDLSPGEIVDFRHEIRKFTENKGKLEREREVEEGGSGGQVAEAKAEMDEQSRREAVDIEQRLRKEAEERAEGRGGGGDGTESGDGAGGSGGGGAPSTREAEGAREGGRTENARAEPTNNASVATPTTVGTVAPPHSVEAVASLASSSVVSAPSSASPSSFPPSASPSSPPLPPTSALPPAPSPSPVLPSSSPQQHNSSAPPMFPSASVSSASSSSSASPSVPTVSSSSSIPPSLPSSPSDHNDLLLQLSTISSTINGTKTERSPEQKAEGGGGGQSGGQTLTTNARLISEQGENVGETGGGQQTAAEGQKKRRKRRRKTTTTTTTEAPTTTPEEEEYDEEEEAEGNTPKRRMK